MNKKEQIESLLYDYPQLVARIKNKLTELGKIDYSLAAIRYDKIPTTKTNVIYSDVEEFVINKHDNPELEEMIKQKLRIDNSLECLTDKEKELVLLYYWENNSFGKILDKMCEEWDVYSEKTLRVWRDKIIDKLYEVEILTPI